MIKLAIIGGGYMASIFAEKAKEMNIETKGINWKSDKELFNNLFFYIYILFITILILFNNTLIVSWSSNFMIKVVLLPRLLTDEPKR